MDELLTQKELAEFLKITEMTLYRWRKEGMPYIKAGKQVRYEKEEVLKWLKTRDKND
jgi:excisionase family DNA binding protein